MRRSHSVRLVRLIQCFSQRSPSVGLTVISLAVVALDYASRNEMLGEPLLVQQPNQRRNHMDCLDRSARFCTEPVREHSDRSKDRVTRKQTIRLIHSHTTGANRHALIWLN